MYQPPSSNGYGYSTYRFRRPSPRKRSYGLVLWVIAVVIGGVFCARFLMAGLVYVGHSMQTSLRQWWQSSQTSVPSASQEEDVAVLGTKKGISARSPLPLVSAEAYTVIDVESGTTYASRQSNVPLPIASLTKLVTAVTVFNLGNLDVPVTIIPSDLEPIGAEGGLKVGEKLTRRALLYPLLMTSSNDAAEALARSYGRNRFVNEMNVYVSTLGAKNTSFVDPSGLSPFDTASAHDVALIMRDIWHHHQDVRDITTEKTHRLAKHVWVNKAHTLNFDVYRGGKIGFTDEAGSTGAFFFAQPTSVFTSQPPVYATASVLPAAQAAVGDGQQLLNDPSSVPPTLGATPADEKVVIMVFLHSQDRTKDVEHMLDALRTCVIECQPPHDR
jgi:D-alanyl-D-alanine endopeptidase (penicillin-binding protein 7)